MNIDRDRDALEALFFATCGASQTLEKRRAFLLQQQRPHRQRQQQQEQQSKERRRRRGWFERPPEFVSTAAAARAVNLAHGRYDDCYAREESGVFGPGFYLTTLGRGIGERLALRTPLPFHATEVGAF